MEAARAVLGTMPEGAPSPVDIPQARKGGAVIGLEDGTAAMCRFAYVDEDSAESVLQSVGVPLDCEAA